MQHELEVGQPLDVTYLALLLTLSYPKVSCGPSVPVGNPLHLRDDSAVELVGEDRGALLVHLCASHLSPDVRNVGCEVEATQHVGPPARPGDDSQASLNR